MAGPQFAGMSVFSLLKSERMGVEAVLSGCIQEVSGSNLLLSHAARTTCSINESNQLSSIGNLLRNFSNVLSVKLEMTVRLYKAKGLPKSA